MPRPVLPLTLALLAGALPLAAQNPDSVSFSRQRVADGLYMLRGAGGNVAVASGKDGVYLVDDDFEPNAARLREAVGKVATGPVRFLINTHWHGDHTGGNAVLGGAGAIIVAQDNVRQRMSREQVMKSFNETVPAAPPVALPVITFTETMTLYLNGDTVDIVHAKNAHTDGDAIIHWRKANVIHAGDTFFNGFYPFIDYESGGTVDGMIAAADTILALSDDQTKIIPGHGPLGNKAQLRAFRDMMATVRLRFARARAEGKTAEQVVNAHLLSDLDATWGQGFLTTDQFSAFAYPAVPRP